jgi:hypothetical protein
VTEYSNSSSLAPSTPHSGPANTASIPNLTTAHSTLSSHFYLPPAFRLQPVLFPHRTPDPTLSMAFDGFLASVRSRLRFSLGCPRQPTDQISVERQHRTFLHLTPSTDELLRLHSLLDRTCDAVRSKRNHAHPRLPHHRPCLRRRPRRLLRPLNKQHRADCSSPASSTPFIHRKPLTPIPL